MAWHKIKEQAGTCHSFIQNKSVQNPLPAWCEFWRARWIQTPAFRAQACLNHPSESFTFYTGSMDHIQKILWGHAEVLIRRKVS